MRNEEPGRIERVMHRERRDLVITWLVFGGLAAFLFGTAWFYP